MCKNTNVNGYAGKGWPDIVANLRVDQAWGSAQVMAAVHDVNAGYSVGLVHLDATGWAVGAGIKINAPMLGKGDYFIAQAGYTEGAINYIMSGNTGKGGANYYFIGDTNSAGFGSVYDAVNTLIAGVTDLHLTTGWSVTGGYEHRWNPNWKTSIYGAYGKIEYNSVATPFVAALAAAPCFSTDCADWSHWQVGTRTVWTPVENFDLSVDVMYNELNSAYKNPLVPAIQDQSWWSGMFRVQRNFFP